MPHTLFISDLHLTTERPQANQQFFDFLQHTAPAARALYILGDLFEYWVGDDDTEDDLNGAVAAALAKLAGQGVAVYFMHGNRDFLVGQDFGDTLCTDDIEYHKQRAYYRNPQTQAQLLQLPLVVRHQKARELRAQSETSKSNKAAEIMDVSPTAVEQALREHGYPRLIHGHTHRPARHEHVVDGHTCERWVLGDWYQRGNYFYCDAAGVAAKQL
jgi:UDP-2,3-diacylglucosamine hydrolase